MSKVAENLDDNQDDLSNQDDLDNQNNDDLGNDDSGNNEPQLSESDQSAIGLGWKPKDEWEGDPDEWTSSKRFLQTRDIIESNKSLRAKQDRMENEFSGRIDNLQKLHDQTLKSKIESLKTTRDNAAQDADMDTYNAANKEIDALEKVDDVPRETQPNQGNVAQAVYNHPSTQAFISENPWIRTNDAKGVFGQRVFSDWISQNLNNPNAILEDGLKLVKDSVSREFPQNNPNRNNSQQMGDKGKGPSKKQGSRNRLTMDDLSRDEMSVWNSMGHTWKNEADYLQAVADSRKGE